MARLFTSGFELNSTTNGVEFTDNAFATIQGTTVRSGAKALQVTSLVSGQEQHTRYRFKSSNSNGPFYFRTYFRYATLPTAGNTIIALAQANNTNQVYVQLNSDGTLSLFDEDGQIGSASSALSANTWYRIEILFDTSAASGSHVVTAKIDGTNFATASNRAISAGIANLVVGGNIGSLTQTQGNWFFDDIALNDGTGGSQNTYPGSGKVILLSPNAAGDSNSWLDTAGSAGTTNNFQLVDELPPNDVTDFVQSGILNSEDLYNVSASGLAASDTINVVHVGVRFRNDTADAVTAFKVECEKTSGGTKSQSAAIVPNSTTWKSNSSSAPPADYPLTLYLDPDGGAWTNTTLDSMQIGVIDTVINVNKIQVSAMWVYVDYVGAGVSPSASISPSASRSPSASFSASVSPSASRSPSASSSPSPAVPLTMMGIGN